MMSTGGFSKARLRRLHDVMAGHVGRGDAPGIVTAVSRRGEVHVNAIGTMAVGGSEPMRRDTLFRILSMTKPITAVAALILAEECVIRLDEPVDRLLPELAERRVLSRLDASLDDTVPANRPITVRDLLTFRLGWGMVSGSPDSYPILKAVEELGIVGIADPDPSTPHDPDEWLRRLSTLPLMHQPGEQWMYNMGSSVLGVLIERASGKPFETFLRERIFEPLGMQDTSFSVPPEKLDRLASGYEYTGESAKLVDGVEESKWASPPAFPDGSAGLVTTVDDYLAFGQMLLNNGRHGSERILSRPSVEAMTTDQLTPEQRVASPSVPRILDNLGWGFGVSITLNRNDISAVPGKYGWEGGFGTSWTSDPSEELVGVLMTQRLYGAEDPGIRSDFWTSAYQSIDD